ncbi:MAG: universal stress protein [Bacteroidota bacterium]|nr:universal stress protein [Bacteroidota bacterium]
MIEVKKILVTTDLSTASHSAIEYAAWLSRKENASVTLFYSVDNLPTVAYHTVDLTFDKFRNEILQHEVQRLQDYAQKIECSFPKKLNVIMTVGNAAQMIVQQAKEEKFDIIVMNTHGRTGIQHILLGSVAERVVRTAECPVLTVKSVFPEKVSKAKSLKKKNLSKK